MSPQTFFDKYGNWAVESQSKSGVPASITLAQAAIESGWGESRLARTANNFFGLKTPGLPFWTGGYVLANDDKPNEKFRKYDTVYDSFIDHADFLKLNNRYDSLFDSTDYRKWAKGLQAAGYASSNTYASSLINTIEEYGLQKYDTQGDEQMKGFSNTVIRNRYMLYKLIIVIILLIALFLVTKKIMKTK